MKHEPEDNTAYVYLMLLLAVVVVVGALVLAWVLA